MISAFYATLAALAAWATWKDEDLRWVGVWLTLGFGLSSALYYLAAPVTAWPGPYTLIEVFVALAAYCAWGALGYRLLIVLVAFNLASIGVNINFASAGESPSQYQIYVFVVGTNICFAAECLLTLSVGIAHGLSTGRFRFPFRRVDPQPNVAREDGQWTS